MRVSLRYNDNSWRRTLPTRRVSRSASRNMSSPSRHRPTQPALQFIAENLHRHLSLADCARICHLSPCEFSRRFHADQGASFSQYLLRLRVERAATLLAEPRRSVSDVAYSVGFNDLSYFARVFRRFAGMPASAYRQSLEPLLCAFSARSSNSTTNES
jgi:AraC-like DNA-binding protein